MNDSRHSVLIDLDRSEPQGIVRSVLLLGTAAGAIVAAVLVGDANAPSPSAPTISATKAYVPMHAARTLALPADVTDADLSAFPDWLANEAPPASLRAIVAVRGTMGSASVEGLTVINWTEYGISYRLESVKRSVNELVQIANALR